MILTLHNTTKNGLKFCIDNRDSDFITISYYINAGSFDEPTDLLGIAHLTEHLVFKGTLNRKANEVFTEIEQLGGTMNAYTTETHTVFYVTILKEYWKQAIDVLSDIVWNNTIPEDEFEREKNVVLEEIKMYHDDGHHRIIDLMTKTAYKNSPNKWNNGGTIQSVSKITKQNVENFIDNFYVPNNITIYITGAVDESIIDFVEDYIKHLSFNTDVEQYQINNEITIDDAEENIDTTQSHLIMYFPYQFETTLHNTLLLNMVLDIFGNGFSSRLIEIREKYGYAYTLSCNSFEAEPKSLIYVYIGLNKENINKTKEIILQKMSEIQNNGITDKEFTTAYNCYKTMLKKEFLDTESINDLRILLRGMQIDIDDVEIESIIDELDSIKIEELNNFYQTNFNPENVGCITLLQTKIEE